MKNNKIIDKSINVEFVMPSNIISEEILISNNTVFKDKVKEFLFNLKKHKRTSKTKKQRSWYFITI